MLSCTILCEFHVHACRYNIITRHVYEYDPSSLILSSCDRQQASHSHHVRAFVDARATRESPLINLIVFSLKLCGLLFRIVFFFLILSKMAGTLRYLARSVKFTNVQKITESFATPTALTAARFQVS